MINANKVEKIFHLCQCNPDKEGAVIVKGIIHKFAFDPKKLKEYKEEIIKFLSELPTKFRKSGGGGWSFLNACNTKDGEQWTGLHQ